MDQTNENKDRKSIERLIDRKDVGSLSFDQLLVLVSDLKGRNRNLQLEHDIAISQLQAENERLRKLNELYRQGKWDEAENYRKHLKALVKRKKPNLVWPPQWVKPDRKTRRDDFIAYMERKDLGVAIKPNLAECRDICSELGLRWDKNFCSALLIPDDSHTARALALSPVTVGRYWRAFERTKPIPLLTSRRRQRQGKVLVIGRWYGRKFVKDDGSEDWIFDISYNWRNRGRRRQVLIALNNFSL